MMQRLSPAVISFFSSFFKWTFQLLFHSAPNIMKYYFILHHSNVITVFHEKQFDNNTNWPWSSQLWNDSMWGLNLGISNICFLGVKKKKKKSNFKVSCSFKPVCCIKTAESCQTVANKKWAQADRWLAALNLKERLLNKSKVPFLFRCWRQHEFWSLSLKLTADLDLTAIWWSGTI